MTRRSNFRFGFGTSVTALIGMSITLIMSCDENSEPRIVVENIQVLPPSPGASVGVAYFELRNRTDVQISLRSVTSPQFQRVEMHETSITNGVSKMRKIGEIKIDAGQSVIFETGGKHLMLLNPITELQEHSSVTLIFQIDDRTLTAEHTLPTELTPRSDN